MNAPITMKATVAVWFTSPESEHFRQDLAQAIEKGDTVRVINNLTFYGVPGYKINGNWARMGEADITLRLIPKDEQTRAAVQMLNAKLDELRAAYHTKQQEIMEQISKLQALEYVEAA